MSRRCLLLSAATPFTVHGRLIGAGSQHASSWRLRPAIAAAIMASSSSAAHLSSSLKRKQHQSSSPSSSASARPPPSDTATNGSSGSGSGMGAPPSRQPTLFDAGFSSSRRQPSRRQAGGGEHADDIEDADQDDSKQSSSGSAAAAWRDKKRRTGDAARARHDGAETASSSSFSESAPSVVHDRAALRFSAAVGGDTAYLEYAERRVGSGQRVVWDIWHTSVPASLRQRGLAVHLCMAAFAAARSKRYGVIASCTYVSNKFLVDHPEQTDIVVGLDKLATTPLDAAGDAVRSRRQEAAEGGQRQQQTSNDTPRKMNSRDRRTEQTDSPQTSRYGTRQSQLNSARLTSPSSSTSRNIHTQSTSTHASPLSPTTRSSPPPPSLDWYRHAAGLLPAGTALPAQHCPLPHHPVLGRSHFPRILADIQRYQSAPPTPGSVVLLFVSLLSRPSEDDSAYIRDGLHFLLQHVMSTAEQHDFLDRSLPFALRHIHDLPVTFPLAGLPLLTASASASHSVHYSKHEVAAILSCSLFSMHAEHRGNGHVRFPSANFKELIIAMGRVARSHDRAVKRGERDWQRAGRAHNNDIEKLRCMLHYFSVAAKRPQHDMQNTIITFHRRSIADTPDELLATALLSSTPLPAFTILPPPHTIEDDLPRACPTLHLDFANKYIGGGVLGHGCVQEEILFSIAAECLASLLFCERMEVNEAIVVVGAERFCRYAGYGGSFEFAGGWDGKEEYEVVREENGRRRGRRVIVAIDAIPFSRKLLQWQDHAIARELLKAYVGFSVPLDAIASDSSSSSPAASKLYSSLSTGNWGCGAFNGDVPLKGVIQLVAAGLSGRDIRYFTFGDRQCDGLDECVQRMKRLQLTVGEATKHTIDYARRKTRKDPLLEHSLLDYINKLQRDSDGTLRRADKSERGQAGRGLGGGVGRGQEADGEGDGGMEDDGVEDDEVVPESLEMILDQADDVDVGLAMKERLDRASSGPNSSFEAD